MLGKVSFVVACTVGVAAAQPKDPWVREIVDYGRADGMVSLSLVNGAPSITVGFPRDLAVHQLVRGAKGWDPTALYDGRRADLLLRDPSGATRIVLGSDRGRGVLVDGKLDVIGLPAADGFDVAFDARGGASACAVEGSNLASYVKLAERGVKPGGWKISEVSNKPARQCAVAVAADGSPVVATANNAEAWVHVRRGGTWTSELLSKEPGGSAGMIAAATAPDGSVAVVFVDGRGIQLARLATSGWTRSELVKDTGGVPGALALAFDGGSRAHVAYMTWVPIAGGTTRGAIGYAVAGGAASKIEDAVSERISLVIDAAGAPHLAYVHGANGSRPEVLVYVRARRTDDAAAAWISDTDAFVPACAEQLAVDLGRFEDPDVARRGRAERLCRAWDRATPTVATIEARCTAGDAGACLVGGSLVADNPKAFSRFELVDRPCGKGKRCTTTYYIKQAVAFGAARDRDGKRSRAMYEKACELGNEVGCMLAERVEKACSPTLPIACAMALDPSVELDAAAKKLIRAKLTMACATRRDEPGPEACNALAYLEDTGGGGPKNPAAARAHHAQACLASGALSCTKLVGGAKPKGLTADGFADMMDDRCENGTREEVCVALATAYQTGWLVGRDPAAAKRLFTYVCDELGSAEACKRAGKQPPAKSAP